MKLTEEEFSQMLRQWGERESARLGLDAAGRKEGREDAKIIPINSLRSLEAGSVTATPPAAPVPFAKTTTTRRVLCWSAITSAMAACLVAGMMVWLLEPTPMPGIAYTPRTAALKMGQTRLKATTSFAKGWRRAGLVVSVSDYSAFRSKELPDLPLVPQDAAMARRVMQAQTGAPREHVISLSNHGASEVAVMAALKWLKQFNQPGDLVMIHLACHSLLGPDGRLRLVLADSRDSAGKVTGLPAEDVLRELEALPGIVVLVADTCQSGVLEQLKLGPRQAIVASAGEKEQALDSIFGTAWLGGLESGAADRDLDGAATLQEAFDHAATTLKRMSGAQRPRLLTGGAGLAAKAVLALHPQLLKLLPERGIVLPAAGTLEFTPDGPCELWLGGKRLGVCTAPVALPVGPGIQRLRAVREEWGPQRSEWNDPAPVEVPPGGEVRRAAVFSAPQRASAAQVQLFESLSTAQEGLLFPAVQSFGDVAPRSERLPDGRFVIELPATRRVTQAGVVMLAGDAVTGVNLTSILGVARDGFVRLSITARAESGMADVSFFVGGRISESLNPRIETKARLDDQWQTLELRLPASLADRVVTGFGVEFGPSDKGGERIFIRDVTFRR